MCDSWYEEQFYAERMRVAQQLAEDLKKAQAKPAPKAEAARKPEREVQTDPVPV